MMGFFSLGVKFFVLVLFLSFVCASDPTISPVRRGLQNLVRVGKRYGDEAFWEFATEDKRFGKLMVLPRIGRSSSSWTSDESPEKRSDSNTGMWFGPRIGRRSSFSQEDTDPLSYLLWNNGKSVIKHNHDSDNRRNEEQSISSQNSEEEFKDPLFSY